MFQCKVGSETASMSSISSTDESFRWAGLRGGVGREDLHYPTHQAYAPSYSSQSTTSALRQQDSYPGQPYHAHAQQVSLDGSVTTPGGAGGAPGLSAASPGGSLRDLPPPQHEEPESDAESKMSNSQLVDSCL